MLQCAAEEAFFINWNFEKLLSSGVTETRSTMKVFYNTNAINAFGKIDSLPFSQIKLSELHGLLLANRFRLSGVHSTKSSISGHCLVSCILSARAWRNIFVTYPKNESFCFFPNLLLQLFPLLMFRVWYFSSFSRCGGVSFVWVNQSWYQKGLWQGLCKNCKYSVFLNSRKKPGCTDAGTLQPWILRIK